VAVVLMVAVAALLGAAVWGMRVGGVWRVRAAWAALWLAAACAGFSYAAWRAHVRLAYELPVALEGRDIDVVGHIKGLPSRGDNGVRFVFAVESAAGASKNFPQLIQLSWIADDAPAPAVGLEPGARWRFQVRLKRPHGNANFGVRDGEAALFARNIRATGYIVRPASAERLDGVAAGVGVQIDRWRAALRARIDAALADAPHRGIVVALAIGAQDVVSAADWQLMRATGTSHLVAISGLHIGFVAGLAAWLSGALWRRSGLVGRNWPLVLPAQKVSAVCGAMFAACHAALAGFNVPAQRALWMLAVVALSFVSGRTVAPLVVLAWALGLVLLIDPWAVVSAGFWLSFCAVAAILFAISGRVRVRDEAGLREVDARGGGEPGEGLGTDEAHGAHEGRDPSADNAHGKRLILAKVLARRADPAAVLRAGAHALMRRIRNAAHVQFAVTVALAPLTAYWFAQIPLIGPFANAFAIPWVSALVTPLVIVGVMLPAPFDAFAFVCAHRLLEVLVLGLQQLSGLSWALWRLPQPDAWALAAATAGVAWCLAPRGWPLRWAAPLAWLPLLAPPPGGPPHGAFRLTALDIGQGSAIVVQTAHHTLLFDAGPGPESTHAGERIVVPYLQAAGIDRLDTFVISHADSDHAGGAAAVFDGIGVRQLVAALPTANPLWERARAAGAQTVGCAAGQHWQWDGVDFTMLWPDSGPLRGKPNEHCCVLHVSVAATGDTPRTARPSALLAADIEAAAERILLARDPGALQAHVLLVPHHGSKTSSTEPFLDSVRPLVAIFQVGYRNRFHHPHPGVFERYRMRRIELPRSDQDGAVRIETGAAGEQVLTLERYRDTHRRYWMDP
jgi:competence protein ComEC